MAYERIDLLGSLGGIAGLRAIIKRFYDRLFSDPLVGFFFHGHDKARLITSQISYLLANLGDGQQDYEGPSIRSAHQDLPITTGHFDRRHQILKEVLGEFEVDDEISRSWLAFDQSLRNLIVARGSVTRDAMTGAERVGLPMDSDSVDEPGL